MRQAESVVFSKGDQYVGDAYRQVVDVIDTQGLEAFVEYIDQHYPDRDWDTLHITFEQKGTE